MLFVFIFNPTVAQKLALAEKLFELVKSFFGYQLLYQ